MPTLLVLLLLGLSVSSLAQNRSFTIDQLYDPDKQINFNGTYPRNLRWLSDGLHYVDLDDEALLKVNAVTGEVVALFDAEKLQVLFEETGIAVKGARRAARRSRKTLCPSERGLLINWDADLFYYHLVENRLVRLTNSPGKEQVTAFSPSGKLVAFVRENDLYVVSVETGNERRLTKDGTKDVLNGILDWVYQEEIYGRGGFRGFWWSPDSSHIAFLRLDQTMVPEFSLVNHDPLHQDVRRIKYPKAGDSNPEARVGVVSVSDGQSQWADMQQYRSDDLLIVAVSWTPDASKVVVQLQNRLQKWLDLHLVDIDTGQMERMLRETSNAWVTVLDDPYWLQDGSFLWQSERTGFRHLEHYSPEGNFLRAVTSGDWEVLDLEAVDENGHCVYFTGTRDTHLETHLYRVGLDGMGMVRLTRDSGSHGILFSPALSHYLDTWSDFTNPPRVGLFNNQGSLVREIARNQVQVLKEYGAADARFIQVEARDGFELSAVMIKPPDFDPRKEYPVLCHTYSGPHSHQIDGQKVRNKWGGTGFLWHRMMAQEGYIVWICDSRTSSGKGASSAWPAYGRLGEVELSDLEDMVEWLRSKPFVDENRIGLWGWSYGGFMTLYALSHSDGFKLGIAGAPVTDWRLYDSIYTERYMGLPAENPEGYRQSSVLQAAANVRGNLILIHGAMDENVHVQNTYKLSDRLQKAGKQFELMIYPRAGHSINEAWRLKHLRLLMTRFIKENL